MFLLRINFRPIALSFNLFLSANIVPYFRFVWRISAIKIVQFFFSNANNKIWGMMTFDKDDHVMSRIGSGRVEAEAVKQVEGWLRAILSVQNHGYRD